MSHHEPLCMVDDLSISYYQDNRWTQVVSGVSLHIGRGEALGLVGESGCGKSTVAMQLLGYRHAGSRIDQGRVVFAGKDLSRLERSELENLRGREISFVPQNPTTALNPAIRVGRQVTETILRHGRCGSSGDAFARTVELFGLVGLPQPETTALKYPHQLSGGQQQRVCIAMAIACDPALVVMDEPTTGLDVTTQRQIIDLLIRLRQEVGLSMLYVTHDLALLAQIADRIGVMYAGRLVEVAPTDRLFSSPGHPYTRGLLASAPRLFGASPNDDQRLRGMLQRSKLPAGCPFAPRCDWAEADCAANIQTLESAAPDQQVACRRWRHIGRFGRRVHAIANHQVDSIGISAPEVVLDVEDLTVSYPSIGGSWGGAASFIAVNKLRLSVRAGEILALVGESGSGKSTIARAIGGLIAPVSGSIKLGRTRLVPDIAKRSDEERRDIQYIFQNPDASLNPRKRIGVILGRPLQMFFNLPPDDIAARISEALQAVRLDPDYAQRFPDQLSGGERQRVAIARALVARPSLLICDEILSALDVSVQANILDMLRELQVRQKVSMLFISHDLAVVRNLADSVAVMFHGELMQIGETRDIYKAPFHPYTHSLLAAVPRPNRPTRHGQVAPVALSRISGAACAFAGRCPWQVGQICVTETPPWRRTKSGATIRCHVSLEELNERGRWLAEALRNDNSGDMPRHAGKE